MISRYLGLVSLVDTHVGQVLDALDEHNLFDRSVVAYTSDYGDMVGHQQLMIKNVMFEQSIRVPLVLSVRDIDGGRIFEQPVSHIDLVPTLLDALGQSVPAHLQGDSLLPFLRGEVDALETPYIVVEQNGPDAPGIDRRKSEWPAQGSRPHPDKQLAERAADFATEAQIRRAYLEPVRTVISPELMKLNYHRDGERELYDLKADPDETENIAGRAENADTAEELTGRIFDWQVRTRDPVYLP